MITKPSLSRTLYSTALAILVTAVMTTVIGCGDKDRNPDPPPKPVGQNNVFGDTIAAKERVNKDVKKAMDENQKKLDEAMQKQDVAPAEAP